MLYRRIPKVNHVLAQVLPIQARAFRTTCRFSQYCKPLKGKSSPTPRPGTYATSQTEHVDRKSRFRFFEKLNLADPLRILFCGSDEFSAESLRQLHNEKISNPDLIESIHVVLKAGKPAGRGLKEIRDVPLKAVARELSLPISEIPTFTGWTPPSNDPENSSPPNLVIAVSFGLLIPPRILSASKYGGLNVHPSLLPDLRGPAPLQWTLLEGRKRSGITVQSLHPKHFDGGMIVAQSKFNVPNDGECTYDELHKTVTPAAAKLLVYTLRKGLFRVRPHEGPSEKQRERQTQEGSHARKITSTDSLIDWYSWDVNRILRWQRALGNLSGYVTFQDFEDGWDKPLEFKQRVESSTVHRAKWYNFRFLPVEGLPSGAAKRLNFMDEEKERVGLFCSGGAPKDDSNVSPVEELERKPLVISRDNFVRMGSAGQMYVTTEEERDMFLRAQGLARVVGKPKPKKPQSKKRVIVIRTVDGHFLSPEAVKLPGAKHFQDPKRVAALEMEKSSK